MSLTVVVILGHTQEEVRVRALENIINKLNYDIVSTMDLACDKSLISNLLQWFNKPNTPQKKACLDLILRISKVNECLLLIISTILHIPTILHIHISTYTNHSVLQTFDLHIGRII